MGPWSRLYRDDPKKLEIELAKAGTKLSDLARDIRDVPELRDLAGRLSHEARELLAVEHFGDQGHPQPENRTAWVRSSNSGPPKRVVRRRTPDFGRLPPLDEPRAPTPLDEHRGAGRPEGSYVEAETFWKVWEMALDGLSARAIDEATSKDSDLKYVNRDKAGVIVKSVVGNRAAARRALGGREIPQGFSATFDGIKLPKR